MAPACCRGGCWMSKDTEEPLHPFTTKTLFYYCVGCDNMAPANRPDYPNIRGYYDCEDCVETYLHTGNECQFQQG